jgi:hypothetical protein
MMALLFVCAINNSNFVRASEEAPALAVDDSVQFSYTFNVSYEALNSLEKSVFAQKIELRLAVENLVKLMKNEIAQTLVEYSMLPFELSDLAPVLYVSMGIFMEEGQEGYLFPRNQCGVKIALNAEKLEEYAVEYAQFMTKMRAIVSIGCEQMVQILKQYEEVIIFEANKPAIILELQLSYGNNAAN